MKPVVIETDVNVEDVAVLKYSLVRNAVANDLVGRCTYRLWEVAVIEGRRIGLR